MNKSLLTTRQAAQHIGMSCAFLERDRCYTARIPFIKLGTRAIRYRLQDLDAYIEQQYRRSTSDQGDQKNSGGAR